MNKTHAKAISESGITCSQIKSMLKRAYDAGAANDQRSKINPVMSRAAAFNIFWRAYSEEENRLIRGVHCIGAKNAIYEFGDYWEGPIHKSQSRQKYDGEYHHEPAINIYETTEQI